MFFIKCILSYYKAECHGFDHQIRLPWSHHSGSPSEAVTYGWEAYHGLGYGPATQTVTLCYLGAITACRAEGKIRCLVKDILKHMLSLPRRYTL